MTIPTSQNKLYQPLKLQLNAQQHRQLANKRSHNERQGLTLQVQELHKVLVQEHKKIKMEQDNFEA